MIFQIHHLSLSFSSFLPFLQILPSSTLPPISSSLESLLSYYSLFFLFLHVLSFGHHFRATTAVFPTTHCGVSDPWKWLENNGSSQTNLPPLYFITTQNNNQTIRITTTVSTHFFFNPSNTLVMHILNRFGNHWFFPLGKRHSPQVYNLMVDILGKAKKFDLRSKLVKEMKGFEGYVTSDTMTKVIRRFAKAQRHQEAVKVVRRMGEYGFEKDTVALNKLLDALVKGQSIEIAHNVLDKFKTSVP